MKRNILISILLVFAILAPSVLAAEVHGSIFSPYLEKLDKVIVEVNSQPKQTVVSSDGTYSFNLPQGDYIISAVYDEKDKYAIKENITITNDGEFNLDLVLFPDISEDEVPEDSIDIPEELTSLSSIWVYVLIAWLVLIFVILYLMKSAKKLGSDLDEELDEIVQFIKKSGGRVNQKDIRKRFTWSEAKISLIITELEDKKVIKKIKKGRTNVIILER